MAEITGVNEVVAALGRLPEATRRVALKGALEKAAELIKRQAEINIAGVTSSEATGLLARSIVVKSIRTGKGNIRVAVAIAGKKKSKRKSRIVNGKKQSRGTRVGLYGSVLEFGKKNQPPRPFLRPAIAQKAQLAINIMGQEFSRKFDEAVMDARK